MKLMLPEQSMLKISLHAPDWSARASWGAHTAARQQTRAVAAKRAMDAELGVVRLPPLRATPCATSNVGNRIFDRSIRCRLEIFASVYAEALCAGNLNISQINKFIGLYVRSLDRQTIYRNNYKFARTNNMPGTAIVT